jgi:hypothetical protein
MRRVCRRFSWNTDNGWLWRQKVASFARRFGLTGIEQIRMFFGPPWAYHKQAGIFGERLDGVVFPLRAGNYYPSRPD